MKTTAKRFEYLCCYIGGVAGVLTFGGIIFDAHRLPAHLWWALYLGSMMALTMYMATKGMGRLILFAPAERTSVPPKTPKSQFEKDYLKHSSYIQNR